MSKSESGTGITKIIRVADILNLILKRIGISGGYEGSQAVLFFSNIALFEKVPFFGKCHFSEQFPYLDTFHLLKTQFLVWAPHLVNSNGGDGMDLLKLARETRRLVVHMSMMAQKNRNKKFLKGVQKFFSKKYFSTPKFRKTSIFGHF